MGATQAIETLQDIWFANRLAWATTGSSEADVQSRLAHELRQRLPSGGDRVFTEFLFAPDNAESRNESRPLSGSIRPDLVVTRRPTSTPAGWPGRRHGGELTARRKAVRDRVQWFFGGSRSSAELVLSGEQHGFRNARRTDAREQDTFLRTEVELVVEIKCRTGNLSEVTKVRSGLRKDIRTLARLQARGLPGEYRTVLCVLWGDSSTAPRDLYAEAVSHGILVLAD